MISKIVGGSWLRAVLAALILVGAAGCADMRNQPRYDPLEPSEFFPDGSSARPLPEGVVARGAAAEDDLVNTSRTEAGELVDSYPFPVTLEVLEAGQEQYKIYCAPCHGLDGYGEGMIVQRGFPQPPSLHTERMREAPAGHYFEVITNGFGQMYSYASRVTPEDRWAITAYIRALQLSQNAPPEAVPPDELEGLE